jgi:two-component system sensor histidine kinase SenX3
MELSFSVRIFDMKMKLESTHTAYFVVALLVISLSLLAYFQFTWLGQLSEEEYTRMKTTLRNASFRFSFDFDQEMFDIIVMTGNSLEGNDAEAIEEVRARLNRLAGRSLHPQIVSDTLGIVAIPQREVALPIRIDERHSVIVFKDLSGFAIPINGSQRCVFVKFNEQFIQESYLPELVRSHFVYDGVLDYDILVSTAANRIYFSSTAQHEARRPDDPDVEIPFFAIPDFPIGRFIAGRPPEPPMGEREESRGQRFDRTFEGGPEPGFRHNAARPQRNLFNQRNALLVLLVKHRDGSLQLAVDRNRWRNLGVSAGILLLLGASVVFLVITVERSRKLAQQQLEFVAGVSHELRTPLAVLKSAGENLADGVIQDKDRAQQYGQVIKSEVGRLSDMLEKALLYAGIQSGKRAHDYAPVDMGAVIKEVVNKARACDVSIETTIDPELPLVHGDTDALHSLIENLLSNAVKYSSEKKWVGIAARPIRKGEMLFVEIAVRDKGIGIPQQDIDDVFLAFHRGSNARDAQIQGSGLGLSLTRHILEAHKGTISVQSKLDEGTEFVVQIPAIQEGTAIT